MPKYLTAFLVVAMSASLAAAAPTATTLYVSPNGNDSWTGAKDKPFATLTRARDEVRKLKRAGGLPEGGVVVAIMPGRYQLTRPLELNQADAGTLAAPIVYRAAKRGTAIITGGVVLAGWRPVSDPVVVKRLDDRAKGRVYEADIAVGQLGELPGFSNGGCGFKGKREFPLALFQAEERLPFARWPNEGYVMTGECLGKSIPAGHMGIRYTEGRFVFKDERLKRWTDEPDLWFEGLWFVPWADSKMPLKAIDLDRQTIALENPDDSGYGYLPNRHFFAFNAICEIDRPGEWAVDRANHRVYLWPAADLKASPVTLAACPNLVWAEAIAHTTFEGLVFEACRERALVFRNSTAVTVSGCTLRHTGSWGVDIDGGRNGTVIGCDLHDLGEGGVQATGGVQDTLTPGRHLIENNHIHHFGRVVHTYRYGAAVYGVGNAIRHNLIHHAQHTALFFRGNDHLLEYNIIHDVCLHSSDAGALHPCARDWTLRGVVIRHNFFHSTGKGVDANGCHGIYLDDYTSGATIVGNICSMVGHSVTTCGNGNRIENNLSINSRKSAFALSSRGIDSFARANAAKGRKSHLIRRLLAKNKPYRSELWRKRYPNLPPLLDMIETDPVGAHDSHFCIMRNNVNVSGVPVSVRNEKKVMRTCTIENNVDLDSDPGFVDYAHFDLRLRPDSPIFRKLPDFKPLEFEKMGLYDDPRRASPAVKFGADITPMAPIMSPEEREKAEWPILCQVPATTRTIHIDGALAPDEWPLTGQPTAVLEWDRDMTQAPRTSRAWIATDHGSLCFGFHNDIDPRKEATAGHQWGADDGVEIALSVVREAEMPGGLALTVTILRGYPDGHLECVSDGGLSESAAVQVTRNVAFAAKRLGPGAWSAEWRIPFAALGHDPRENNWPILAHLSAHQAASNRTVGWRKRWGGHTWDVKAAYALCLSAFGPIPFAPGAPACKIRIDVQADRKATSSTMEPGEGATVPAWAKKWNRLVAPFGVARADRWTRCQFEFVPLADAVVALQLLGTQARNPKLLTWTYYDDFRVEGAELVNGDFEAVGAEGKPPGWNCVFDQNWQATPSSKAGVVENEALAASGKRMARACCEHRVIQSIKITKGRKVTVRFQARGALPQAE